MILGPRCTSGDRSTATIDAGGVLPEYTGVLVRDGYSGYTHLGPRGARVVRSAAGRDVHGVYDAEPDRQLRAAAMADTLLAAPADAQAARAAGRTVARLRAIQLNRTEARHARARQVFHGQRGQLRQRYREGQEDQLGALGLATSTFLATPNHC